MQSLDFRYFMHKVLIQIGLGQRFVKELLVWDFFPCFYFMGLGITGTPGLSCFVSSGCGFFGLTGFLWRIEEGKFCRFAPSGCIWPSAER